ncbi:hypothetical protein [Oceanicola sp. 502str15]|uniref:hypothetical protein n=1 Tax=Oceanicola sp. 502str15 TaxID=2696061 RepID=UPI0020961F7C|nr:hypothetical protein [Oceanicola sp. 502str15]MCO6384513.1 hypothetical protein [Oceanicola sp. 502str15]
MKTLFAALVLTLAALPLRAELPPQGSFLLATYLWNEAVLPRSVLLTFEGGEMRLEFIHPLPLDHEACDRDGICAPSVQAATARARVEGGKLVLEDFEIDEAAAIEPSTLQHLGMPQDRVYTNFVISYLQMAGFAPTDTGFRLISAGTPVEFFRVTPQDAMAIIAVPVLYDESIAAMAGCEVRVVAPLLARPDPTPAEARFIRVLRGVRTMVEYDFEARRAAPALGEPTAEDRALAARHSATSRLPGLIAAIFRTPEEGGVEAFRTGIGLDMFRGDAQALDAAIAAYGDALPDMVAFFRHTASRGARPSVDEICADPSLGFLP